MLLKLLLRQCTDLHAHGHYQLILGLLGGCHNNGSQVWANIWLSLQDPAQGNALVKGSGHVKDALGLVIGPLGDPHLRSHMCHLGYL